jgi:hypothetical protein
LLIESHKAGDIPLEDLQLLALSHFFSKKEQRIFEQLQQENQKLKQTTNDLKSQIASSKIFTYMIIHDLKHPTELVIASLNKVLNQL